MAVNKRRLDKRILDMRFERPDHRLANRRLRLVDAELGQLYIGILDRRARSEIDAGYVEDGLPHGQPGPGLSKIYFVAAYGKHSAAECFDCDVAEQVFHQRHVVLVVLVRRHRLDHLKLWMMAAVDTFVSEVAADRVDFVESCGDQTL